MNRSYLLLLFLLLFCHRPAAMAQSLSVLARDKTVAPGDTLEVSYYVEGGEGNYKNFKPAAWTGFEVIGGPYQSQTSNQSHVDGKMHTFRRVQIIYKLRAQAEGTFVIGPASVQTAADSTLYSDSLTISVVPGYKKKVLPPFPYVTDATDMFGDNWLTTDPYEMINRSKLFPAHLKLSMSKKKYILIVGWPYYVSSIRFIKGLLRSTADKLRQRKDVQLVDSLMDDDMMRYYYVLNDTTGVRDLLKGILDKGGTVNKSAVILTLKEEWSVEKETHVFDNEHLTWGFVHRLTKNGAFQSMIKTYKEAELQVKFRFRSADRRICLTQWATQHGYRLIAADDTTEADSNQRFFSAGYAKTALLNEASIYEMMNALREQGREAGCEATLYELSLVIPRKKK